MATLTLNVGGVYPAGTSVSAWEWHSELPPGAPPGTPVATATVSASTTLTFSGLDEDTSYLAYAGAGTPKHLQFNVDLEGTPTTSGLPGGAEPGDTVLIDATGSVTWATAAVLTNDTPLQSGGSGAAGTSDEAARADHVHPPGSDGTPENWRYVGVDVAIPFQNGWVNIGSGGYVTSRLRKDGTGNLIYLEVNADGSAAAGTTIFTLPATYRPAARLRLCAVGEAGALQQVDIQPSGEVFLAGTIVDATPAALSLTVAFWTDF